MVASGPYFILVGPVGDMMYSFSKNLKNAVMLLFIFLAWHPDHPDPNPDSD